MNFNSIYNECLRCGKKGIAGLGCACILCEAYIYKVEKSEDSVSSSRPKYEAVTPRFDPLTHTHQDYNTEQVKETKINMASTSAFFNENRNAFFFQFKDSLYKASFE